MKKNWSEKRKIQQQKKEENCIKFSVFLQHNTTWYYFIEIPN